MFISKYSCCIDFCGRHYLFNTFNSALIELDDSSRKRVLSARESGADIEFCDDEKRLLEAEGFLVDTKEEENRMLSISMGYHVSKYQPQEVLKIDIGVTDRCNFTCPYCFENGQKNTDKFPTDSFTYAELFSELREYINSHVTDITREIELVWYGGEPSLEMEFVCFVNKRIMGDANLKKIHFSNIIITNGYEIDDDFMDNLKDQNVKFVQVTLDGLEKTHNERRNTFPATNSFETIVNNIEKLVERNIEVVVRINIDQDNKDEIEPLLEHLHKRFENRFIGTFLFVTFGRVFGSEKSLSHIEYEDVFRKAFLKAVSLGLVEASLEESPVGAYCGAETINGDIVIDFKGNIYKCWNDIFNRSLSVGNFMNNDTAGYTEEELDTELYFMEKLSLDAVNNGDCLKCEYIKFCGGLCPYNRKMILEGKEENLYENKLCKEIVKRRIETFVEAFTGNNS